MMKNTVTVSESSPSDVVHSELSFRNDTACGWRVQVLPNVYYYPPKVPCFFHRWMQRFILDHRWERVDGLQMDDVEPLRAVLNNGKPGGG